MDLIVDNNKFINNGISELGPPLIPRYYGAAGIGPRMETNYKKALFPGEFSKDPVICFDRYRKVWNFYQLFTLEEVKEEFAKPTRLLTSLILAADTDSEDYLSRYVGLTDNFKENMHRIVTRSMPVNRYAGALWDPRFGRDGDLVMPSRDNPRFEQILSDDYSTYKGNWSANSFNPF